MFQTRMPPHGGSDELLDKLLSALGKGNAAETERANLKSWLRSIKTGYEVRTDRITSIENGREVFDPKRELLQKLHANITEGIELRRQLGARIKDIRDAGAQCVAKAKPPLPVDEFKKRIALSNPALVDQVAAIEAENIRHLLSVRISTDYKKPPFREYVIKPFLEFLDQQGIKPSRKYPLSRMTAALFDYLEIPPTRRPDDAGIRTIVRDMKAGRL
jgi:hypothetical protein